MKIRTTDTTVFGLQYYPSSLDLRNRHLIDTHVFSFIKSHSVAGHVVVPSDGRLYRFNSMYSTVI